MILAIGFGPEGFSTTILTFKWPQVLVYSHVNPQIRFLIKRFTAAWKSALMRLDPSMLLYVIVEADLALEDFVTPLYRACKLYFLFL